MKNTDIDPAIFPPAEMPADQRKRLERFPNGLKDLLIAELALGNSILDVGAGHPAAPAGERAMLAKDICSTDAALLKGLSVHTRNTSIYNQEVTDSTRHFSIVTAPLPPPEPTDMDAIRAKHMGPNKIHVPPPPLPSGCRVEVDYRGEMLIYHEVDRRADIIWTWSQGSRLAGSTLSMWWYPAERLSKPMTPAERIMVLERLLQFAGRELGPTKLEDQ